MGLKKYIEENGLENEPAGLALLAAAESAPNAYPQKGQRETNLYNANEPRPLITVLESIGIVETDQLEDIRTKIRFALSAIERGGKTPLLEDPEVMEETNDAARYMLETPLDLPTVRVMSELAKNTGKSTSQQIREHKSITREELIRTMQEIDLLGIKNTLKTVLEWIKD